MYDPTSDSCVMCGGDGRIGNAFGATKTCPGCGGSGRRMEDFGHRDVTKTKTTQGRQPASQRTPIEKQAEPQKRTTPVTPPGIKLASEVRDCAGLSEETKVRLVREIVEYEASHGGCTQTFSKKVRKQIRAVSPS
jgi:hypothetical protein